MKVIVYTVNIGGYDNLHPSPKEAFITNDDFEYLYFTDGEAPLGWKKVQIESGDRKASRFWKINSHLLPGHDVSIYLDACYQFKKPISKFPALLEGCDIAVAPHQTNTNVYDHAINCIKLKLDNKLVIFEQVGRYAKEGLPEELILTENSLIIRANNKRIKQLNELWWEEYKAGSQRDQLSLPYALWKIEPRLKILPFSARENKWLTNWAKHNRSREWTT